MSANVFLENSWCWRGISDWNDASGYRRAEHLFLAQCKEYEGPSGVPLSFECALNARPAVESQVSLFLVLMPVLLKLPHPFYQLSNNSCSSILACKGPSWYSRWSWGLTIKKQFLQNTGGDVRRSDVRKAVWLSDVRLFVFQCWPVVIWILSDQNWALGYIDYLNIFVFL